MSRHQLTSAIVIAVLIIIGVMSFYVQVRWWYVLIPILAWHGIAAWGSFNISSGYHLKAVCSGTTDGGKQVAITFDDGPGEFTPMVLDVLKKYSAPATFFCIGKNIQQHPQILARVVAEGHLVGNHSYSHSNYFDLYRKNRVVTELRDTDALIERATGRKNLYFRPPYGVTTPSIRQALAVTGHTVIGWSIRSLDAVIKDEQQILERIKKRLAPGGIILLHDTSLRSVHVLEQLLIFLKQNGYSVVSLEQLLRIEQ